MIQNRHVIDLNKQTTENLLLLLNKFIGFNKIESVLLFKLLRIPTLNAIILTDFDKAIHQFLHEEYGNTSFIIRTDKRAETINLPRGGYKSLTEDLDAYVLKLLREGRVVFLLGRSLSRYDHIYSMNLFFEYDQLTIEVIGKGFDVSDLNRGDVSPHEILEIPLIFNEGTWDIYDFTPLSLVHCRIFSVSKDKYAFSVEKRFSKIGKGLTEGKAERWSLLDQSVLQGQAYLKKIGKTLIFENNESYKPMPFNLLKKIVHLVYFLPCEMKALKKPDQKFCLSCGVYYTGQIIFWDIVWPNTKFVF